MILKDPAVESLSSFIGIDGTNTTLNSGRILINLKPLEERKIGASDVIRRLQPELAQVAGITLFMQPVQDITVDDRVSRTQFQYTLEDPSADELNTYAPRMLEELQEAARTARRGQRPAGAGPAGQAGVRPRHRRAPGHHAVHHRPDAVRRLRPARSLHHVHAVEPVSRGAGSGSGVSAEPARSARPVHPHRHGISVGIDGAGLGRHFQRQRRQRAGQPALHGRRQYAALASSHGRLERCVRRAIPSSSVFPTGGQVPLSAFSHVELTTVPITVNHQGQFPVVTLSFNLAPDASLGDAVDAVNRREGPDLGLPASIQAAFQGTAQAFQASLANEPVLILAALVTVYIVLGVLYESYIHPVTILSTLPSAGVGALLALYICRERFQRDRADRHRAADRHREEERHHDDRFRAGRGAQGGHGAAGRHLPGLSAAFPAHHDDHHGGAAGRRAAGASARARDRSCAGRWASRSSAA